MTSGTGSRFLAGNRIVRTDDLRIGTDAIGGSSLQKEVLSAENRLSLQTVRRRQWDAGRLRQAGIGRAGGSISPQKNEQTGDEPARSHHPVCYESESILDSVSPDRPEVVPVFSDGTLFGPFRSPLTRITVRTEVDSG